MYWVGVDDVLNKDEDNILSSFIPDDYLEKNILGDDFHDEDLQDTFCEFITSLQPCEVKSLFQKYLDKNISMGDVVDLVNIAELTLRR